MRAFAATAIASALLLIACSADDVVDPPLPGALPFSAISAGYYHTCGLSDGRAYCWGGNEFGTLGDGTHTSHASPNPVAGGLRFTALDAGAGHNCAITAAGVPWCWGQNDEGQSGDGTFAAKDAPVAVIGGHTFTAISAGHAHSCGLTSAGTAFCWGDDSRGQLGNGATGTGGKSATPVQVAFDGTFAAVYAGYYQSCALDRQHRAYCWGLNDQGQNGNDDTADVDAPVAVAGGLTFDVLAPGDRFVCGVSSDDVWCWGANRQGELGSAGAASAVPVRVATGRDMSRTLATSMGASTIAVPAFACATDTARNTFCWGGDAAGLPTGGAPGFLNGAANVRSLTAGSQHVCAIGVSGYAWCGGANGNGQLGTGNHVPASVLVPVHRSGG